MKKPSDSGAACAMPEAFGTAGRPLSMLDEAQAFGLRPVDREVEEDSESLRNPLYVTNIDVGEYLALAHRWRGEHDLGLAIAIGFGDDIADRDIIETLHAIYPLLIGRLG